MKYTNNNLAAGRKSKIFIIEDSELQLKMAVDAIRDTYDVITALSAKEAMEILKTTTPDLILLDVELPETNGYEVIKKIKSSETLKDIPVIFLTSRSNANDETYGLSLGAVDYIKKPYSAQLLLKRLELHLASIKRNINQNLRLNLLLDSMDVALWDMIVDPTDPVAGNNKFWWSQEFRHMLGFSNENDFPNVLHSWSDRLHHEDKERTLDAFAAHINDYTGKTPYDIEYRLMLKDGQYRHFSAYGATLRDSSGVPLRVAGALEDITEIKEMSKKVSDAEELTRLMLDTSPLCCQLWDSDLNIIDCNLAAVRLYGFKSKREYIDQFFELMPEYQPDGQCSKDKSVEYMKKAFTDGYVVFDWVHKMLDGTLMPAEITLVRVKHREDYLIAGYTNDLREIKSLEEKAEAVYYDALTGIYNRRYLDENVERIMKSLSRYNGKLSLMMIDIDCFKQYNDTHGHGKGDNCLKIVAEIISKTITRTDDFVARYGGEEFTVVLPNTDENGARKVADKLLENVRKRNIPHKKNTTAGHVTISIGITTGNVESAQSRDDYIKQADIALYNAKQNGRNRYTFAPFYAINISCIPDYPMLESFLTPVT